MSETAGRKLKPCPFCGGSPKFTYRPPGYMGEGDFHGVRCTNCPACIAEYGVFTKEEAARLWNRRSNGEGQPVEADPGEIEDALKEGK